eukprot:scaffold25790_cov59-Phaeocystis_antarctica.AAC.5
MLRVHESAAVAPSNAEPQVVPTPTVAEHRIGEDDDCVVVERAASFEPQLVGCARQHRQRVALLPVERCVRVAGIDATSDDEVRQDLRAERDPVL